MIYSDDYMGAYDLLVLLFIASMMSLVLSFLLLINHLSIMR